MVQRHCHCVAEKRKRRRRRSHDSELPSFQKNERENKGFKIKNFKILKYLKFFGSDVIDDSKLDLLSIFIPHLYDFNQLQAAYLRLEFSKKTMKYYNFLKH